MAKLPKKLVQAPSFDSPLRRTSRPERAVFDDKLTDIPKQEQHPAGPEPDELLHRVTVRLSQRQWEAVQTECFRQRMVGKKTNASALVRELVDQWIVGAFIGPLIG